MLMIPGAFCGGWCFDAFRRPFEAAGREVRALDLPGHAPGSSALDVAGLSVRDYARAVTEAVRACARPPVLLAHSLGGLVAQLAAAEAPVAGLVLLAPSPAWGQPVTSPVELAAGTTLLATRGPYWAQPVEPDYPVVRAFTYDRLGEDEARAAYARMTPESGRALFEVLNWWLDATRAGAVPDLGATPALVLGGGADRVHAPPTLHATAARLRAPIRIFPGMSHWLVGEPGWEAVAHTALGWLEALDAGAAVSDAAA